MTAAGYNSRPSALPDPERRPDYYAGVPLKRAVAWAIDMGLTFLACLALLPFTAFLGLLFWPLMMLVVGFLYRWWTLTGGSATWGMRFVGIEIRDASGQRLSSGTAMAHTIGTALSFAVFPAQLVSAAMMLLTPRGQGLTDLVLGTAALNRPR